MTPKITAALVAAMATAVFLGPVAPRFTSARETRFTSAREARFTSAQDTRPPGETPAKPTTAFHHVHLNSVDPAAAIAFYTRTFGVTQKSRVAVGDPRDRRQADPVDVVSSENMFLLFTRVSSPPATEPPSAIWHFGWGSPDMPGDFQKHRANGVTFATPLSKLATGTEFAYMQGPDAALVEINTSATRSFIHVHLYAKNPLCTADWYVAHLGAVRRGSVRPGPCEVPYADPSEPYAVIRQPAATVRLGDINLIVYPQQREGALVSPRGHVVDHIALGVPNFAATLGRLERAGVKVLRAPYAFGDTRAVMIEGPDAIAIELVEQR